MIGGERRRQQPRREFPIQRADQWAKPQGIFNLKDVLAASLISIYRKIKKSFLMRRSRVRRYLCRPERLPAGM